MFEDLLTKAEEDENFIVNSSWIKSFSFKDGTLTMKTLSDLTYEYYDVPRSLWEELKGVSEDGGSVGEFFNQYIK